MEIDVNGVKYQSIEKTAKNQKASKSLTRLMVMASMFAGMDSMGGGSSKLSRDRSDGINIIEEYGLIQQKKSKLSRAERNSVVWKFERNFKKVEE